MYQKNEQSTRRVLLFMWHVDRPLASDFVSGFTSTVGVWGPSAGMGRGLQAGKDLLVGV